MLAAWYDGGVNPSRIVTTEFVDPLVFNPLVPLNTGNAPVSESFELIPSLYGDPIIAFSNILGGGSSETRIGRVSTTGQLPPSGVAVIPGGTQSPDNLLESPSGLIRVTINQSDGPGSLLYAAQISAAGQLQWIRSVTPSDGNFSSTVNAALINGSQESLIVLSRQLFVPQPVRFALLRVRSNGSTGGAVFGPDLYYDFGQSNLLFMQKKRKATLMGDLVIRNDGTEPIAATAVGFYHSPITDFSPEATLLFEVPIPALAPLQSVTITPGLLPPKKPGKKPKTRKVKFPKTALTLPINYILIRLDNGNVAGELIEDNNDTFLVP